MSGSTEVSLPTPTRNLVLKSKVELEGEFSHLNLLPYLDYWRDFHQRPTKSNSQYRDEFLIRRKEFLMAGHSNVGKSSLLNSIFNTDAAHVSKTPGKTRNLFFYKLTKDPNFILVDAPGYGYAVGSRKEIDNWAKAMNIYLKRSQFVHRVLVLVDGSRGVSDLDETLITMLDDLGIIFFTLTLTCLGVPFLLCLTKCDKASSEVVLGHAEGLMRGVRGMVTCNPFIHLTSVVKGFGVDELTQNLNFLLDEDIVSRKLNQFRGDEEKKVKYDPFKDHPTGLK
jgi:ribosome biogenesis GTP-binding protein YsxC/EngB